MREEGRGEERGREEEERGGRGEESKTGRRREGGGVDREVGRRESYTRVSHWSAVCIGSADLLTMLASELAKSYLSSRNTLQERLNSFCENTGSSEH